MKTKTAKKKTKLINAVPPPAEKGKPIEIEITAREYQRYFNEMEYSMIGIMELAKEATDEYPLSDARAGFHALERSVDKLSRLDSTISDRFKSQHGESPLFAYPDSKTVSMTSAEVEAYEDALGPAASFIYLIKQHDLGDDLHSRINAAVACAGQLVLSVAMEAVMLFRARVKAAREGRAA